jgi:hypothetical protein
MSFDENKLDDPETYYNTNKFKSMICRAKNCKHNQKEKPICKHEWVEIEDNGRCIFNTHPAADVERLVEAATFSAKMINAVIHSGNIKAQDWATSLALECAYAKLKAALKAVEEGR